MIEEAVKCGLKVDRRTVNQLGWAGNAKNSPFDYVNRLPARSGHSGVHHLATAQLDERAWRAIEYLRKGQVTRNGRRENQTLDSTSRMPSRA